MPSQHAPNRTPVTYRLDGEVLVAAKRAAEARGDTMTGVVDDRLAEYAGVHYVVEHDCEDNTFASTGLTPSAARKRARELRRDPTVTEVRMILRASL